MVNIFNIKKQSENEEFTTKSPEDKLEIFSERISVLLNNHFNKQVFNITSFKRGLERTYMVQFKNKIEDLPYVALRIIISLDTQHIHYFNLITKKEYTYRMPIKEKKLLEMLAEMSANMTYGIEKIVYPKISKSA